MKGKHAQKTVSKAENQENVNVYLIAQYLDVGGTKRKVSLGPVKTTRKSDAEERLATILEPINSRRDEPSPDMKLKESPVREADLPAVLPPEVEGIHHGYERGPGGTSSPGRVRGAAPR